MNKKLHFCFRRFFMLVIAFLSSQSIFGQTVEINTGTAGTPQYNAGPIYRSSASSAYDTSRYSYLYTQAELATAGITSGSILTALGWAKNNSATTTGTTGGILRIYIKNSTGSNYSQSTETWSNLNSGATMVYESLNQAIPATTYPNYISFTLSTPFTYTGGDIEIQTEWDCNQISGNPSTGTFDWMWSTVSNQIYGTGQTSLANAGTLSSTSNSISSIDDRRPYIQISYTAGTPCTSPPTAGTTTVDVTGTICPGSSATLNLSGNSSGSGMTYEWESSPNNTTYTSIGAAALSPSTTINPTTSAWYRCKVVCSGGTPVYSTPLQVNVSAGLAGVYTINSASPTGGTNFASFADVATALSCGISAPVTFNVVSGSGPYNEIVSFGAINGSSAANTIRINGNGETVQFTNTSSDRQLLTLDGTKYLRIDSLTFKALATGYGWGALITGGCEYDSITNCTFDLTAVTASASASSDGIVFSNSTTSATSTGTNGSNCYIYNNTINATTGSGGPYYGIALAGDNNNNIIKNNLLQNVYYYSIYTNGGEDNTIDGNEVTRSTKTNVTTFYGIYSTGTTPGLKIINNKVHTPGGTAGGSSTAYAIRLVGDGAATNPVYVYNNLVYNLNQGGTIYGIYLGSSVLHNKIYHNTVDIAVPLTGTSSNYGLYASGTNTGSEFKNNIVSITAGTLGTKYGFYYSSTTSIDDAQKNNIYVNSSQSGTQNYGYYTSAYATQAAFQTAHPTLEVGSPELDPQFQAPATGNFTPTNSMIAHAGENLSSIVTNDINGMIRATTPTIGAVEAPAAGPDNTALTSIFTPTALFCAGAKDINIALSNAGTNTITAVTFNWTLNAVAQTPFTLSTNMTPFTSTGDHSDTATITGVNITAPSIIKVWVAQTNNVPDTDHTNDTLVFLIAPTDFAASSPTDTICPNGTAVISLDPATGYNTGDLEWESSVNNTTWTPVPNSDDPTYITTALAQDTWFRVHIINGGSNCFSSAQKIVVNDVFVDTAYSAERCGPGTLTLSATGSPGTTLKWYSSATSTTPLATGTSFTTPVLSSNTDYWVAAESGGGGGSVPELMYYKFDVPGSSVTNDASNPVGVNPAPITGLTIGGTGQFGTGLQGTAGATASNRVSPGWTGTHTGSWTISFWMDVPTPPTTRYMFGNTSGNGTFRCFIGGAANGIRLTGGVPSITLDMPAWTSGQSVITYVYDQTAGTVSGYIDGVFQASATPGSSFPLVGTNFVVGSQGTAIDGIMDEFRMYSRALSAAEIAGMWNTIPGGCESIRKVATATINPLPDVALGNDTALCPGASMTLDANTAQVAGNTYLWSTGATTATISVNTPNTYSVAVTNASNCTAYDTLVVDNAPLPVNNLNAAYEYCEGDSAFLDAGNAGNTFLWSNGATTQTIYAAAPGTYEVTITNAGGCSINSTTDVIERPLPVVELGSDTIICNVAAITLDAQNPGSSYIWNNGSNSQTITPADSGTYSVNVTTPYGCYAADTIHIAYFQAPETDGFNFIPLFEVQPGMVRFNVINPVGVQSYLWDFGDGATDTNAVPTHTYAASGNYLVKLKVSNDCSESDTSLMINVDLTTGIRKVQQDKIDISVYPNPANQKITVQAEDPALTLKNISIFNAIGQKVITRQNIKNSRIEIILDKMPQGAYMIWIQTSKGQTYRKFNIIK